MDALTLSRLRMLKNWARCVLQSRWEFFKVCSVLFFGFLLIGSIHWWFYRSLNYIAGVPAIGNLLMKKLFEIAFLSAFSLIALSAMVTSLSTHFGSRDLPLLFSTPIHPLRIFFQKAVEAMIHASWMITLVLIPFLMVLMKIKGLDAGFLFLAFALFIPFAMSASSVGISLSAIFVSLFPRQKLTELLSVLGVLIFTFAYAGVRLTLPRRLIEADQMENVLQYILYLESPAGPYLPSRWYVEAMNAYIAKDWARIAYSSGILFAFALAALALLIFLGSKVLTQIKWNQVLEGSHPELPRTSSPPGGEDGRWPGEGSISRGLNHPHPALSPQGRGKAFVPPTLRRLFLLKELRFFLRDSQRFSNVSFILAVCAIYLVSIYRLPMDTPQLRNFISFVNLALGLFIIAALSLRFCFPQPSIELQYSWIVRASPVEAKELLGSKLIFNFIFLNIIGAILICVSPMLLGTDLALIPIYLAASIFCSTTLSILALAVGSAFPKIRFENIIQIETSFGGFLFAVFSLAYVGVTLAVFAWPIRYFFQVRYLKYSMEWFDWVWMAVLIAVYAVFSVGAGLAGWWSAKRSWRRLAFAANV
ncbi:MAG: hypothetical protein HY747_09130 [Elusimicrobia bacterium]|nr:hypothetical protein [Elusimicrobiota bacterium]